MAKDLESICKFLEEGSIRANLPDIHAFKPGMLVVPVCYRNKGKGTEKEIYAYRNNVMVYREFKPEERREKFGYPFLVYPEEFGQVINVVYNRGLLAQVQTVFPSGIGWVSWQNLYILPPKFYRAP